MGFFMKKELLAPAGDIEAGYAALYYGADAVYLGLKQFSARATANNFTEDELDEFVGFAHSLGRKVFVTINTVLQDIKKAFSNLVRSWANFLPVKRQKRSTSINTTNYSQYSSP